MKTENNASEMITQVQTFFVEEIQELVYDNEQLEHWEHLVKQLNLSGQTQIQQPQKSPIPFMPLNETQENILKTLCPRQVDVKAFDVSPIPVELIDLIALSVREGYFQKIEVWYDQKTKDPAVIGMTGSWRGDDAHGNTMKDETGGYREFASKEDLEAYREEHGGKNKWSWFHEKQKYILGRWGEVKEDFSQLAIRAKDRFIGTERNEHNKRILESQRALEDLDVRAFDMFGV